VTAQASQKSTLTVMTLNLWGSNKWEDRRSAVIDWINEVQPDLLALQEVVRTRGLCQASWIAERTAMTAVFGAARAIHGGEFGNAVLSRMLVLGSQCHPLTDASTGNEPRAVITVEVDAGGRRVSFSSTHLSWQFDEGWIREQQVRDIADAIGRVPYEFPPIVCGDINARPESTEVRFLTGLHALDGRSFHLFDAFEVANPGEPGYTWSNANPFAAAECEPDRRIDYILVGFRAEDGAGRVLSAEVVCNEPRGGAWPSDHFGVAAKLSLPGRTS
jgi:endonuclease/exonuclease/phosphatase family metal-dependent hydrolase